MKIRNRINTAGAGEDRLRQKSAGISASATLHLRQLRQYLDAGFLAERRSSVMQSKLRLRSQPGGLVD
jgi:hypothetical protein